MTIAAILTWLSTLTADECRLVEDDQKTVLLGQQRLSRQFQTGVLSPTATTPRPLLVHAPELEGFGRVWSAITLSARGIALRTKEESPLYLVLPSATPQALSALTHVAARGEDWHCLPYTEAYRTTATQCSAQDLTPSPTSAVSPNSAITRTDQLYLGRAIALPYQPLEDQQWQAVWSYLA